MSDERIKSELHSREVQWYKCPLPEWRFQPPAASHMSGVWERLVRSVKKAMKAVLGSRSALNNGGYGKSSPLIYLLFLRKTMMLW